MADQRPKLPIPTAEDIKKFKAVPQTSGKTPLASTSLPIPTAEDIKKFKTTETVEKKKPMASPSVLEKPAVSSVTGLRPLVPSSESISPRKDEIVEKQPTSMLGGATQPSVSVTGSQGKLLIPERKEKFPAVTEKVTTYKKVPIIKSDDNLPLNPELMLKAIFKNEQGTLGKTTSVKASGGMRNTASGTYQMTDETKRDVFNRSEEFKKQFGDYGSFLKEFNKNPSLEFQAALSHMTDLAKQYGKYALAAWYSPTHAAQAASGNLRALNTVPRRDAGNKMTVKSYYNNALNEYKKLTKDTKSDKDFVKVPVKTEIVKEPAVEVTSLEKFNVLSPNYYGGYVSKEEKPKEPTPKKVGAIENIYNNFLSSTSRLASGIAGLPNAANKAALMVTTKLLGIDDEYNALPVQAKKEVGNVIATITESRLPSPSVSSEVQNYLIKKSDEFLDNTNKSDKYLNERFVDFFKAPSVDKATDLFLEFPAGFAGSLPYMINPMLGAVSAASEQYDQDIKEAGGKLGWGQIINAGVTGISEYYVEKISNGILNRSVTSALGLPKVALDLAKGFVKSVLKDVGMEGAGEAVTQFAQSISDDITKGREINWIKTANEAIDAAITGAGIAAGMRTTGAGIGYLAKKVMTVSEKNKVNRNTSAMMDLNSKKGPDNSPEVNSVIDSKIKELDDENKNIINSNINKVNSLSDDQLKGIVDIDNGISNIYKQRDAIVSNENLDDEEKQSLLDYLKSQVITLNEQKDAIQKQATSEVPIQPEAGASLQMAEGEPQAEPKVSTQEIKGQELIKGNVIKWNVFGNEEISDWTVQGNEKTRGGQDAVILTQVRDGQYGKYTVTHIVPISDLEQKPQVSAKEGQEIVDITANIPKQDLPQVMGLVSKIEKGEEVSSPQDLQTQQNYAKEVESLLAIRAADKIQEPTIPNIDVTTPIQFKEGEMPEIPIDQIDWEASGMGTENDAIDSFGGIIDINVVDVQEKNEQGQYVGRVRVLGQDTSKEGVVVFNDPSAPKKPKAPRKKNVSPEFILAEKILSDSGVYPLFNKVNKIADIVKKKKGNITQEDIQSVIKVYNKKAKLIADSFNKQKKNENIQPKKPRAEVNAEEITQGAQPETRETEQPAQAVSKRREIKDSLEKLKDAGLLRSAITTRKDISQGEIDTQMALTDAMANVWKETTGRDDFYENFYNDVTQGDIDAIMEKGGILFQNLELPQRPLTRVSLGVFDLPEFKKMVGQEVSINSVKDLARTRGKQIEKDLMQTVLEYDKYKDVKKISFDEFRSDVEMQVMKLEKIKSSTLASYGMDNLGYTGIYGGRNSALTMIYNSPIDHRDYGHFPNDFKYYSVANDIIEWDIKQIPGTEQYVAIDKSMPDNTPQDQISNYVGTAGSKEAVERWVQERVVPEGAGDVNIGLFGHIRGWYGGGDGPYYLAEIQSDYFQKNDPNDLYKSQVEDYNTSTYAYEKYNKENRPDDLEKRKDALNVKIEIEEKNIDGAKFSYANAYLYKENGEKLINAPIYKQLRVEGGDMSKDDWDDNLFNEIENILLENIIPNQANTREELRQIRENDPESLRAVLYKYKSVQREINLTKYKLLEEYRQEYIKAEIEKIKNSEKGASMIKQFVASQKIHEVRLLREALRNAAQEGAEILRFPTPYTLAVIEGYVNKEGGYGAPYEIISGDRERLRIGDEIDYGGTRMTILDANFSSFDAAPTDEVQIYNYYDYINSETEYFLDETIGELKRGGFNDINNITQSDVDNFDFGDLNWQASATEDILRNAISNSEDGVISLSSVEEKIEDSIRESLGELNVSDLFYGESLYGDDDTFYVVERSNQIESFNQPDQYEEESNVENFEENISSEQKTVVNKYKELNKVFKKMRPDSEVVTDDNGMQWLETKLTPEDSNNPVIAFQEEGGNIKGAVDFSNDNKASIYIFDGADVSTLAHEAIGHVGRRFLEQLANVDEDFASDYEKAKEWAGVKDNQWTIAAEEKWARGFEKYLRDGKAPIKALKSVFKNLSDWLKNIYKRIKGSSIDIELTPSVTKVFDNLLGARSEVEFKNLAGYDRMMGEVEGIVDKSFKRGVPYMQTMDNAIQYMSTSRVYVDANDTQREAMVREVRKMFKQKEVKAPSVNKILDISIEKQLVNVVAAAKDYRKMRIKDVKLALAAYRERIKEFLDGIKALGKSGKLTSAQVKALLNTFSGDLLNQTVFDRAMARAKRIIEDSQYAEKLSNANGLRLKIRKALSADNNKKRKDKLQASVANMASNLAKVAPKMVDDIDLYLERANEVLAAIRNPKITDVEVIGRMAADINAVNEYAKDELDKQEQARKDEMLDQYDYLVEAGVLNESMSLRDINKLVAEIMDGKPVESDKLKEAGLVFYRSLFNDYSEIINKMLSGTDPITGEATDISQGDKELIRRFLAIDPEKVTDLTDMFNIANAAQEFITNDIIDNMEVMVKNNEGLQNVRMDAENPKMRGYKAVLPWVATFAKLPVFSKIINIKLAPVQEYIRNIFRGETNAVVFEKNSGFTGIYNGSTKAMTDSDIADTEYVDKFYNKKPNGKKFFDVSNVFERGIFADLYRTTFGTEAEVQEEFERKVGQLELTIKEKEKSDKKIDQEEASELQKSYNKIVKGSKNINDVMSKMAKDNIDGVMWWIDKWDSKFPEIDRVAKSTYNDVLERQANYTPEGWVKIADQATLDNDMLSRSFNKMNMSYVDTRRAGTLMKYSASPGLPVNDKTKEVTHIKSYHFDINNSESFKKTLKDIYTAPSIVQYMAYTNSPEFSTIIPDKKTRDNLKEKIAFAINALKDTEIDISAESYRDYNKAMKKFTDIARAQALVSVKTPIMQTVPVVVGTAIDLVNDPVSFAKGMVTTFNMDFHKALNNAGYGISVRGLEAIAALDAAEKRIRESKGLDLNVFNNIAKISNLQLKYLLSKPDIIAARQAWVSYYFHKLKSMGIDTANIDWDTHEFNDDAANYAERKTNSKLNQNIQEMAGQAFASRSQKMRFIRNTVLNFASFAYNMKYRFWTDLTILGSKNSNSIDKADAAKDIVRTTGEGALYVYIGAIVGHYLKGLMFDLVGYDEPEEDKKSAEEYLYTNMLTKGILDLLSPMPGIGDLLFVKGVNSLADLAFGEQEKEMPNKEKLFFVKARPEVEKQFRLYEPPEKTESETYLSLLGGMSGIFGKNLNELYKSGKLIQEGKQFQIPNPSNPNKPLIDKKIEYTDKFDNKIEFSNKEKEMMKLPFLLQTLGTIGLGFRDEAETANKVRRSLEKRARKRMATSKKEKLFYVPKAE